MTLRPDCIHESIQYNSGDYYVTCRGCNAQWPIREKRSMRPDPQELKRLIEDVKTKWYGFAIGTHSGIDAVTASAALYKALEIEP